MLLPPWMLNPGAEVTASAPIARRGRGHNIFRRTLGDFARLMEDLFANEAIAQREGMLQRIDPRAKVIGLIGLIVVATLTRAIPMLALAYG